MFGFKKQIVAYKTEAIENVIGVGLQNRSRFINYGEVSQKNIYAGYAIGKVFAEDQDRLSFEFDAVNLHYLISAFSSINIPAEQAEEALIAVFDNFELSKAERDKFYQRLKEYADKSDPELADKFVDNLDVADFPENFREPSRKILGNQFHSLSLSVAKFVKAELGATK